MPSFYKSHQTQHFFFSTEVHNFSVKRNKNPTEISLVKNHLHTEYTEVTSFSCFSFIIRPTHDYTKIFIDLKRIVQSNYWIYKECFDSPGFHPSSANEASIKLVWKHSAVTLYGCLMASGEICQHQPQPPARCELPSVTHTIPWAGKAQEKEGHALADGPRTEPWTRMTMAGLPMPVSLHLAVSGQWGLSPSPAKGSL